MTDYFKNVSAADIIAERFSQVQGNQTAGGPGQPARINVNCRFTLTGQTGHVAGLKKGAMDVAPDLIRGTSAGLRPATCLSTLSGLGGAQ